MEAPPAEGKVGKGRDELEVDPCPPQKGYTRSVWRCVVLYTVATLPAGLGLLLAYWFPSHWLRLTANHTHLSSASHVIVTDENGEKCVAVVKVTKLPDHTHQPIRIGHTHPATEWAGLSEGCVVRYLQHRHLRYLFSPAVGKFVLLRGLDSGHASSDLHLMKEGLSSEEHATRSVCYGDNSIDVPVKPYHSLFVEEVLHPFYIFQILAVIFWMVDSYYYYACAVFLISTVSVVVSLVQTRRHLQQIHNMTFSSTSLSVVRDRREMEGVASGSLVPGDVLVVPPSGLILPCDAVLLTGQAVVNEAMLTGESVPVTKTPLPISSDPYCPSAHKRHTLFCGTQVVQTRFYGNQSVVAVAVTTGFSTAKGEMVRSILCPRRLSVRFYADAMKFVLILSVLAACGFAYTIAINLFNHYQVRETIMRAFDVITTVVPPALPAALTVGTVYALARLRRHNIFCISPQRVTLCGKVKLVCFDKTGTLTEENLDLLGVKPVAGGSFTSGLCNARDLPECPLLYAMATAHSLATIDGELSGDPIDLRMFQGTGWVLKEPPPGSFDTLTPTIACPPEGVELGRHDDRELAQLRLFTFSSELQRMSVIVRVAPTSDPRQLHVFCKGAPETICRLCRPDSVPVDFSAVLGLLTQQGYRVLAVAHRPLHMAWHKAERVSRELVECDLTLAGLVVMQNRLKTQTTPVISTLTQAGIRTLMITGDHMLTGVCVARECGMVPSSHSIIVAKATPTSGVSYRVLGEGRPPKTPTESGHVTSSAEDGTTPLITTCTSDLCTQFHVAMEGKTFAALRESQWEEYQRVLVKGTVFARMSPDQKAQLVRDLQTIGYGVAMCGDGANDCGALKAAHAGISLSESEASIASPFTSKTPNISCVPTLLREGRCALVTSFSIFKFMALYSMAEFITVSILYAYESNLGDWQYLYIDLVLIFAFSVVMGYTGPYHHLVRRRPLGTLAGVHVMLSLGLQTSLLLIFQLAAFLYLRQQPWYQPLVPESDARNIECSENTILFQISIFQYVSLAVALSTAAPYRRPLYTNLWFLLALAVLIPVNIYLTLAPHDWWPWLWAVLQLRPHPSLLFSLAILELAFFHFLIAHLLEGYILPSEGVRVLLRWLRCKKRPRNKYKHLLRSLPHDWPPCLVTHYLH